MIGVGRWWASVVGVMRVEHCWGRLEVSEVSSRGMVFGVARWAGQRAVTSDPDDLRALDPTLQVVTI
jgi:hypothetical protein